MKREKRFLEWTLSYSDTPHVAGAECYAATVPGIVQLDMQKALGLPDFRTGDHEEEYAWMPEKYWHYAASLDLTGVAMGSAALCFASVDYACDVKVNGEVVLHHEGMFSSFEVDVTPYLGTVCAVEVVVYPAPKRSGYAPMRGLGGEASASCKPPFSYSWDWCPRLITLGICGEAYVELRPEAYVADLQSVYTLSEDLKKATIAVEYSVKGNGVLRCRLLLPDGTVGAETAVEATGKGCVELVVNCPPLWHPVDHGEQAMCRLEVLFEGDTVIKSIGFRRSQLVKNEGWVNSGAPLTCDVAPMTAQINGKRYFLKGSNWVPPEMSPAMIGEGRLPRILTLVKELGMNVLRMWGGGYLMPEEFYDLCDAYGILVWQEFPLACACYSEDEAYLAVLEQEARTMLRRLRNHPCVFLWCGGNELFNDWSGMTNQSPALRLLDKLCYEEDRFTPYIMASPQYGVAHGSYDARLLGTEKEHITAVCESNFTAYTEFGVGSPSETEYLRTFLTEEELQNPVPGGIWEKRHAYGSTGHRRRWFDREAICALTGCADEPLALYDAGNELQGRMYAAMFEECRRKWPRTSMALNWCLNEPWPTAAGNGLINYPDRPRLGYRHVQAALRHQKLSLRVTKLSWCQDEVASAEAWVLNDQYKAFAGGTATITLSWEGGEKVLGYWSFNDVPENTNVQGGLFTFALPQAKECKLSITCPEHPEWNDEIRLYITNKTQTFNEDKVIGAAG